MALMQSNNINLVWAQLIIESVVRAGVNHIFVAPGSRSTPLALAAHHHPAVSLLRHFDERGLGFMALGCAKASQQAVAIITTSGTAVANLHPAVIEAELTQVPLIILTADRPVELLQCGANQAIEQVGIFSPAVKLDLALPTADKAIDAHFVLSRCAHLLAKQQAQPQPVHINCPFREPFYPANFEAEPTLDFNLEHALSNWLEQDNVHQSFGKRSTHSEAMLGWDKLQQGKGLIIVGQLDAGNEQVNAIADWAQQLNWPLLLDIQSSGKGHIHSLHYYDACLQQTAFAEQLNQAEVVIQFGARLVSKRLSQWLNHYQGQYHQVHILAPHATDVSQRALDPWHRSAVHHIAYLSEWLNAHAVSVIHPHSDWLARLRHADNQMLQMVTDFVDQSSHACAISELSVCHSLSRLVPAMSKLFIGNSLPVRLMDMFGTANSRQPQVFTNRGASGIDGLLATSVGIHQGSHMPLTLLIGDTSLLHDLNSLALLKDLTQALVVIILNNDGGAIFNLLPVPETDNIQQDLYQLPHGLDFASVAKMFAINYMRPQNQQEFELDYQAALMSHQACIIEINVPPTQSSEHIQQLAQRARDLTLF
ncbi:2-succinyl-5-enolpyruvyl-6-hydroxy-3-cyclohexene-1-carboxylic-acid synthase [Motilimonas pumila]|uniref:2-succinyl-5-enolpyruvyl-6-hydroxy-3-cyclohexene-1-carboxylate synthase n=1 Tax=Motilimonas pumila TaxID=2303987 RepID=A0A418YH45_9GAMM|nr:2-succinyl-5-enolpyruvyl-6-hydroxy-3-cyclohexene-1-carboxylic-acid synthase [Motilimonas pumila]RJG49428.1 2-succinyl-5-enolpyruvyl-6-hydroxy-3-cyclohexene-1-carboxylic-acid synthase [Motilimonas pumila]